MAEAPQDSQPVFTIEKIYVDDYHVGGYDDLSELEREGRLDPLLRGKDASA